jgi:hypothetical protein
MAAAGEKRARNVAYALHHALGGGDVHPRITDALESRSLAGLSEPEKLVVQRMAKDFHTMHAAENKAGMVGAKLKEFGYIPRRPLSELEPTGSRRYGSTDARLESSKARTERRPRAEFRGTADDVYTENAPLTYYLRGRSHAVKLGRAHVLKELRATGRKFTASTPLKDGEGVYLMKHGEGPREVVGHDLAKLLRGGSEGADIARQGPMVVLHRDLVRVADEHGPSKIKDLENLGRIWDRSVQGRVKTILTVPNPQYHFTNLYGDLHNAYLGSNAVKLARNLGISTKALVFKAKRESASRTLGKQVDPKGKGVMIDGQRVDYADLIKEAEDSGAIGGGFIGRDLADVLDAQGKETAERIGQGKIAKRTAVGRKVAGSKVGGRLVHPIDTIRDASQYREDGVRLATYLGARKRGLSPDQASKHVADIHVDYGDLTTFERSVLRRVFPFYTWTARNVRIQARTLAMRPGKFANLEKMRQELAIQLGLQPGWEGDLRDYEQRGLPVPIPGLKDPSGNPLLLFPKLPATDLNRLSLSGQSDAILAMVTPLIKAPTELTQNYNFFFKDKIDKFLNEKGPNGETVQQLKPAPAWLAKLLDSGPAKFGVKSLSELPGLHSLKDILRVQQVRDKTTGKLRWAWPARLDYVLKQTPLSGTALQFGTDTVNSRGQTAALRAIGFGTGLKFAPLDKKARTEEHTFQQRAYLKAVAQSMRDNGQARKGDGSTTAAYQKILDQARVLDKQLGVGSSKRKKAPAGGGGWDGGGGTRSASGGGGWDAG